MLDGELLREEVIQAACIHLQISAAGRNYPIVRMIELEREERLDFSSKFAVLVAGRPVLVWRDWNGAYKVAEDPTRPLLGEEIAEKEAYQVFLAAAHYLECDSLRVSSVQVQDLSYLLREGAPMAKSWLIWLGGESCIVDRYDNERARYIVRAESS